MQAVNAAVGPKIDHDQFAFKLSLKAERVRVEPSVVARKITDN